MIPTPLSPVEKPTSKSSWQKAWGLAGPRHGHQLPCAWARGQEQQGRGVHSALESADPPPHTWGRGPAPVTQSSDEGGTPKPLRSTQARIRYHPYTSAREGQKLRCEPLWGWGAHSLDSTGYHFSPSAPPLCPQSRSTAFSSNLLSPQSCRNRIQCPGHAARATGKGDNQSRSG